MARPYRIKPTIGCLGRNLAHARISRGLTQSALGRSVGVSAASINSYERGSRKPRLGTLAVLCTALGVEPVDLLAGVSAEDLR